jgi:hypothetical protein
MDRGQIIVWLCITAVTTFVTCFSSLSWSFLWRVLSSCVEIIHFLFKIILIGLQSRMLICRITGSLLYFMGQFPLPVMGGWGLLSFWFIKKTTSYEMEKNVFILRIPLSFIHLWLCCSDFFNPSKKNYFGCVANHLCLLSTWKLLPLRCFVRLGER